MRFRKTVSALFVLSLLCCALVPSASSGWNPYIVGASAAVFKPTNIAGCVLWLRSDLGITKDGSDRVSQWADQSGNGNHITQITADNQPRWYDDQLNGYPSVRFGDGAWFMRAASRIIDHRSPYTVFVVSKHHITARCIMMGNANVGGSIGFYVDVNYPDDNKVSHMVNIILNEDDDTFLANQFSILTHVIGALSQAQYVNGTSTNGTGTTDISTLTETTNVFVLGTYADGGGLLYDGDIVEIVLYNSALSDANRQKLENYANGRYAIYSVVSVSIKLIPFIVVSNLIILGLARKKKFGVRQVKWKDFEIKKAA